MLQSLDQRLLSRLVFAKFEVDDFEEGMEILGTQAEEMDVAGLRVVYSQRDIKTNGIGADGDNDLFRCGCDP